MRQLSNTMDAVAALDPPRLKAPPGACDCHMHFYGPEERYPLAPTCPLPPPDAPVPVYRALMERLGIERVVVVQPSAYGFDNRRTMDATAELGPDVARAVVVVDPEVPDAELEQLTAQGARGLRFFMLKGGVLPWEVLPRMAARVAEFGWHVQLQFDGRAIEDHVHVVEGLPAQVVIDHNGKFLDPVAPDSAEFRRFLRLFETGRVWNKVSAPYETSRTGGPDYADVAPLARALIRAAPERMVWATNWPHPTAQENPPDDPRLLDLLLDWADDEATHRLILSDNPAVLYGFPPAA